MTPEERAKKCEDECPSITGHACARCVEKAITAAVEEERWEVFALSRMCYPCTGDQSKCDHDEWEKCFEAAIRAHAYGGGMMERQ